MRGVVVPQVASQSATGPYEDLDLLSVACFKSPGKLAMIAQR